MNITSRLLLTVALAIGTHLAQAQAFPYTANARAQGAPFDITVTETKRDATHSILQIPGFDSRTASEARWMMCAYTDLAIKRGFSYWTVLDPAEGSDLLVIGFSKSAGISPKDVLGPAYVSDRASDDMTPVASFMAFCGFDH